MTVVVVIASGPSLTDDDVDAVRRARLRSIVINDTYRRMPDASALFAADAVWWQQPENATALTFAGERYVSQDQFVPEATFIPPRPPAYGGNSALRAAHLAEDQGASVILLLGVDLNDDELTHWHGLHTNPHFVNPNVETFRRARAAWVAFSKTCRPMIVNCTRRTSLECFPRMSIDEAIATLQP